MKRLFCLSLLFLWVTNVYSYGPPSYLPDGPHPRIWLTTDALADLNAKQAANDPAWTSLEAWCDANLNDTSDHVGSGGTYSYGHPSWKGYRGSGYTNRLINYSLAYQILKDDNPTKAATYAAWVRDILVNGIAHLGRAGEEDNGLSLLRCNETEDKSINDTEATVLSIANSNSKEGYSPRNLFAVPVAYDWIYDTLSEVDKNLIESMMLRWFDWIRGVRSSYNNGVLISGTRYHEDLDGSCSGTDNCDGVLSSGDQAFNYTVANGSNMFNGQVFLMSLIPVAIYGDNADAPAYLSYMKDRIANTVVAALDSDLQASGGDSFEGWNYGGGYVYMAQGLYGYYTATGDFSAVSSDWFSDVVECMVHRVNYDWLGVHVYGDWTGIPYAKNRLFHAQTLTGLLQKIGTNDTVAALGQYVLNNSDMTDAYYKDWQKLLWEDSSFAATAPTIQPLSYIAYGHGAAYSRSSWTDSETVNARFTLEGKFNGSHEAYDEGEFLISRGDDWLTAVLDGRAGATYHNTIVFNNTNHYPQLNQPSVAIDRTEEGDSYFYVSGDISNAWFAPYNNTYAYLFRRSFLHLRPGIIVVYDATQSRPSKGLVKEWYSQYPYAPTINGNTISMANGDSRIFVETLYPLGGTYSTTSRGDNSATAAVENYTSVSYRPAVDQEYEQFLHVIEATCSSQSQMTQAGGLLSSDGKMRGAYIEHSLTPWVVLFSADQGGGDVSGDITYTVETSQENRPRHILLGLPPNTRYKVRVTDSRDFSLTVDVAGNHVSSSQGVLTFGPPVFKERTLQ